MKIVGIFSSPSSNGNTATLVRKLIAELENLGAEVELIDLAKENLQFCKGCMNCLHKEGCVLPDSVNEIRRKMVEADGLIMGSPSYGIAPNAIMKNFLDRIGMFNAYTALLGDKYIIGISTAGGIGAKKVAKQLTEIVLCPFKHGKVVGTLYAHRGWKRVEDLPGIDNQISKLALKMYNSIDEKKKYRFQHLYVKFIHRILVRRVLYKNLMQNKDGSMKAVFDYMVKHNIINS